MSSSSLPPGHPYSFSLCLLPQFPPRQPTDASPNPAEAQASWDKVTSPGHSTPMALPPAQCSSPRPLFSCRDFDSLSKDNVFENNRLVSPPGR